MNIFFVLKKRDIDGGGLELVTAPLTRGDILPGMQNLLMFDVFISFFSSLRFFSGEVLFFLLQSESSEAILVEKMRMRLP